MPMADRPAAFIRLSPGTAQARHCSRKLRSFRWEYGRCPGPQTNLPKLGAVERELETFQTRTRLLKRDEIHVYADALRRLQRAIAGLIRKVQRLRAPL